MYGLWRFANAYEEVYIERMLDIMNKTIIYGHRGASCYAPENTFAAYNKAIEMGANGIEIDVHKSKDGHLIVCHDEKVDRTTNGIGYIKDLTLKEIKKLDAGSWFDNKFRGEKIPLLNEVLEFVKDRNIFLNIEIKNGPIFYEGIEHDIVKAVRAYDLIENTIISSFNHFSLAHIKNIDKRFKTGILYIAGMIDPWEYATKIGASYIHPLYLTINEEIVSKSQNNGIKVNVFTVNREEDAKLMKLFKVDGIITDCPDICKRVFDN